MAKAKRYKHITIHPSQGGALIGSTSDDIPLANNTNFLASSANYTEKLNFRREVDGELRREGWDLFNPSGNDDAINSQFPIRGLYQFTDIDGNPTLIACAGNKVLKLQAGDRRFAINYTPTPRKNMQLPMGLTRRSHPFRALIILTMTGKILIGKRFTPLKTTWTQRNLMARTRIRTKEAHTGGSSPRLKTT